jgi:hypothetical protein
MLHKAVEAASNPSAQKPVLREMASKTRAHGVVEGDEAASEERGLKALVAKLAEHHDLRRFVASINRSRHIASAGLLRDSGLRGRLTMLRARAFEFSLHRRVRPREDVLGIPGERLKPVPTGLLGLHRFEDVAQVVVRRVRQLLELASDRISLIGVDRLADDGDRSRRIAAHERRLPEIAQVAEVVVPVDAERLDRLLR